MRMLYSLSWGECNIPNWLECYNDWYDYLYQYGIPSFWWLCPKNSMVKCANHRIIFRMDDPHRKFWKFSIKLLGSMWVRAKHIERNHIDLWSQSINLKAFPCNPHMVISTMGVIVGVILEDIELSIASLVWFESSMVSYWLFQFIIYLITCIGQLPENYNLLQKVHWKVFVEGHVKDPVTQMENFMKHLYTARWTHSG